MKFIPQSLLITSLFSCTQLHDSSTNSRKIASLTDNLATYDKITKIVTTDFYDKTFKGLNWPKLKRRYRKKIAAGHPLKVEVNRLLSHLETSHTAYYEYDDQSFHALKSIFSGKIDGQQICQIGVWFEKVKKRWFAKNVLIHTPAHQAGLRSGDEIVSINGEQVEPVESFRQCDRSLKITFRRLKKGPLQEAYLQPQRDSFQESFLRATEGSFRVETIEGKKIAYFHLWSGTHDKFLAALKNAVQKASGTDAFILDLRDGFGGAWLDYIEPFMNEDEKGNRIRQLYKKPLVVLINEGTRSGKEYIANVLKLKKRATLVGSKSAGYVIAGKLYEIDPVRSILYLAVNPPGPDGLEGKGVSPDVLVPFDFRYSDNKDPQLNVALRTAKDLIH